MGLERNFGDRRRSLYKHARFTLLEVESLLEIKSNAGEASSKTNMSNR